MDIALSTVVLLFIVVFIAGVIDSIAGGGGLLTLPAYMALGLPPHLALGTNKFANSLGTVMAVVHYGKKGLLSLKVAAVGMGFALFGAWAGTRLVLSFSESTAALSILFMMPLGIASLLIPKRPGAIDTGPTGKILFLVIPLVCLVVGFYDGFFGPGTGSFLAMGFYLFGSMNLVASTANAKVFNLASNVAALATFIMAGEVMIRLGLTLALASIAGNWLGSHLAVSRGESLIKKILASVMVLLVVSMAVQYRSYLPF